MFSVIFGALWGLVLLVIGAGMIYAATRRALWRSIGAAKSFRARAKRLGGAVACVVLGPIFVLVGPCLIGALVHVEHVRFEVAGTDIVHGSKGSKTYNLVDTTGRTYAVSHKHWNAAAIGDTVDCHMHVAPLIEVQIGSCSW